jgi:hypothetical protein
MIQVWQKDCKRAVNKKGIPFETGFLFFQLFIACYAISNSIILLFFDLAFSIPNALRTFST